MQVKAKASVSGIGGKVMMTEKANEITALMVMAIAGGAVVPPILGFAQKYAGSTGLVWVLLACLAYQAVLSVCMYKNVKEEK